MSRPLMGPFQILANSVEDILNTVANTYQVDSRLLTRDLLVWRHS